MQRRVLGFAFDRGHEHVLLKVARSKGRGDLLSGLGGELRSFEVLENAMSRLARKDVGDRLGPFHGPSSWSWVLYGRQYGAGWEDWLFYAEVDVSFGDRLEQIEREQFEQIAQIERTEGDLRLIVVPREGLVRWPTMDSVSYLVPLAYDHLKGRDRTKFIEIYERVRVGCE